MMQKGEKQIQQSAWDHRAPYLSLVVSVLLLAIKYYAFRVTGSHGVLSDVLESVVNVVAAAVAIAVIIFATKPADREHPYGHGKAEFFSATFEGGLIVFAGGVVIFESVGAYFSGNAVREVDFGLVLVLGAGIVNAALGVYLQRLGDRLQSLALIASGKHLLSDFWTSLGVCLGLVLIKFTGWMPIDAIVGILIGGQLAWSGFSLVMRSASGLLDTEDPPLITLLGTLFSKHSFPGIVRIHYTRIIRSGRYHHIDAHLVLPEFWTVERAHHESNRFENAVIQDYVASGEIHFHVDPCRQAYCRVCDLQNCPVRRENFVERIPFSLEELTSPDEPKEYQ